MGSTEWKKSNLPFTSAFSAQPPRLCVKKNRSYFNFSGNRFKKHKTNLLRLIKTVW